MSSSPASFPSDNLSVSAMSKCTCLDASSGQASYAVVLSFMNYLQATKSIYFAKHNVPIWNISKTFIEYIVSFPSDEGNNEKMFQSSDDNLTEL